MTAFARESSSVGDSNLTVELRSVNHRYLDCVFKLPDALRSLEPKLREQAARVLNRGKLECSFRLQAQAGGGTALAIDREQLQRVLDAAREIAGLLPRSQPLSPLEILQFPGVCCATETNEDSLLGSASSLFDTALAALAANREREGTRLAAMIGERITLVEREAATIRDLLPALQQQQRTRLLARLAELQVEVDNDRLEQELVYLAQKADVDEELDRLQAHVEEVRDILARGGPCGRRLDFLMQELNREANTLSSKSISTSGTQGAVELKVLIEQMREQVQNIE
ncbi:YicC family protein [Kineobactrum salinum]|uniref:YicC family protein n=2 Tax=Kineobactrum salinum TaxID=2708301 RepID=A0A6C0U5Y4_9GAMM|nr:YicC family protein [Kineobactrum salinum]